MTSQGQPKPQGTLRGAGPGPGISNPKSPPTRGRASTLGQLKDQVPRLQLRVITHLDAISHLFSEVQQDLQEHHKQVEALLRAVEACSPALDGQLAEVGRLSLGKRASQGHQEAPRPGTPQLPALPSPQASDLEDVVTTRWSYWLQWPQSGWDPEPPSWQDALTLQLWQVLAGLHEAPAQPSHRVTERALGLAPPGWDPRPWTAPASGLGVPGALLRDLGRLATPQPCMGPASPEAEAGPGDALAPRLCPAPVLAECPLSPLEDSEEEEEAELAALTQEPAVAEGRGQLSSRPSQEPAAGARPPLKLISWDPEDFRDAWQRPDALPQQCKRFALPHKLQRMRVLGHGEPVLAAAVSSFTRHAFTCSRGGVKVWSLVGQGAENRLPDSHLPVHRQAPDAYLSTCLLASNSSMLLTGGHNLGSVGVWDLAAPSLHVSAELPCPGRSCQALAANVEQRLAFAGFQDGAVRIWDLRDQCVVRDLGGQLQGAKSIVVKDHTVWTGGLDARLHKWDLRMDKEPLPYLFRSQIMGLSLSPQEDWLLLGLANGEHWLQHGHRGQARMVGSKDSAVLGLKFSPYGQWWVSVGTDSLVSIHSMPAGTQVLQVPEPSSGLCCDVSADNRLLLVGSWGQASVYLVTY